MQLFHGHQRDDRRRRVLTDDRTAEGAATTMAASPPRTRKAEPYTPGARLENQRRVSDLVPKHYITIGLLFLVGLAAIAGLAAAHLYLPEIAAWAKDGSAALELGSRGSLASWLASLLLGLAGMTSLLIYSIRRHKLDDYRGHYRWWWVAGLAWLVMSVDATAGIHDLFNVAMTRLTGHAAPLDGQLWWLGCWGLLVAATVVRLLLDMRQCRTALLVTVLAIALWCVAVALQLNLLQVTGIPLRLVAETLKLVGHLVLLLGITLYARHVVLHAQGLLPSRSQKARKEKPKKEVKTTAAALPSQVAKVDSPRSSSASDGKPHAAGISSAPTPHVSFAASTADADLGDDLSDYDDDSDTRNRKLTKAERKRLRKQKSAERDW
jgi:hypothetical protein